MKQWRLPLSIVFAVTVVVACAPVISHGDSYGPVLTVTVCNGTDCGPTPDVTPPSIPTGLLPTVVSTSQINLSWDPSSDPFVTGALTSGVAGYNIYRDGGPTPVASTTGTSYSDTGLTASTTYTYSVSAYDYAGNESAESTGVSTTTFSNPSNAPNPSGGAPSGTLSAGTTQVTMNLTTDIAATCRYGSQAGISYGAEPNIFAISGGTSHSTVLTGLTNGNTYTFYVRCESSYNVPMTNDYIISFSVAVPSGGGNPGGGGGGGGGGTSIPNSVIMRGLAYPGSEVTILKDGVKVAGVEAGPDARFEADLPALDSGTYTFNIWSVDSYGIRSNPFSFTETLTSGVMTVISGIYLAPTLSLDKTTVKRGDSLNILGQTAPLAIVTLDFHSTSEVIKQVKSGTDGLWSYALNSFLLDYGNHTAQANSATNTETSAISPTIAFTVGDKNVFATGAKKHLTADLNFDGRVDLADFSILLYWYHRKLTPAAAPIVDINHDGKIDLVDFSIMAFQWTG